LIGYAILQMGSSFVRPTLNGLISKCAPRGAQGLIFGVTQTLMALTQIIAPLLSGALIEAGLYRMWAWLGALVGLAGLILISVSQKASSNKIPFPKK